MNSTEHHERMWRVPVTYAAVGCTRVERLSDPPPGFSVIQRNGRIGHGPERFEWAWVQALSWGIQRGSGLRVTPLPAPEAVTGSSYTPVSFDDDGNPLTPATLEGDGETIYAPDGTALMRPGDTGILHAPWWPREIPVRVVYLVDEPQQRGFAYGTLPGHPLSGEEAFIIEQRPDDSVWLTVRIVSRPATGLLRFFTPIVRLVQSRVVTRYLRALAGPIGVDPANARR